MTTIERTAQSSRAFSREISLLSVSQLLPSPLNPRKHFDEEALTELAASIQEHGLQQPIVVRPTNDGTQRYWIIMGERRWRACQLANLTQIPAIVRDDVTEDRQHIELALIENLARRDLDVIEEAGGYQALMQRGLTQQEIADRVNRSKSVVANAMRLLAFPDPIRELLSTRTLGVSHALALWKFHQPNRPELVTRMAALVVEQKIPSHELEKKELPYRLLEALEKEKLIKHVSTYQPQFDPKICLKGCPYNAFFGAPYRDGACFYPAHYKQLTEEAQAKAQAKIAATQAKLLETQKPSDKPPALPKLASLRHDQVRELQHLRDGYLEEIGCTEACDCRGLALDRDGTTVLVCRNPERLEKRKRANELALAKARREALMLRYRQAVCNLDAVDLESARYEMAVIVQAVLEGCCASAVDKALAQFQVDLIAAQVRHPRPESRQSVIDRLARKTPKALLELALCAILLSQVETKVSNNWSEFQPWLLNHYAPEDNHEQTQ